MSLLGCANGYRQSIIEALDIHTSSARTFRSLCLRYYSMPYSWVALFRWFSKMIPISVTPYLYLTRIGERGKSSGKICVCHSGICICICTNITDLSGEIGLLPTNATGWHDVRKMKCPNIQRFSLINAAKFSAVAEVYPKRPRGCSKLRLQ